MPSLSSLRDQIERRFIRLPLCESFDSTVKNVLLWVFDGPHENASQKKIEIFVVTSKSFDYSTRSLFAFGHKYSLAAKHGMAHASGARSDARQTPIAPSRVTYTACMSPSSLDEDSKPFLVYAQGILKSSMMSRDDLCKVLAGFVSHYRRQGSLPLLDSLVHGV